MKKTILTLLVLHSFAFPIKAQQSGIDTKIEDETKAKVQEINKKLLEVDQQIISLQGRKQALMKEKLEVLKRYNADREEVNFRASAAYTVVRIVSATSIRVRSSNGIRKEVVLSGVYVPTTKSGEATAWLRAKLAGGVVYLRCQNPECSRALFYTDKSKPSLNEQIVKEGHADHRSPSPQAPTAPPSTKFPPPPSSSSRPVPETSVRAGGRAGQRPLCP